jgi:hypothetical protein
MLGNRGIRQTHSPPYQAPELYYGCFRMYSEENMSKLVKLYKTEIEKTTFWKLMYIFGQLLLSIMYLEAGSTSIIRLKYKT